MRRLIAPALLLLAFSAHVAADVNLGQILPKTPPGGEVALAGANLDTKKLSDYSVVFRGGTDYAVPIQRVEPTRLVLRVPGTFAAGPYLVFVTTESGAPQFVGQIDIVAAAPQIHRLVPLSDWWKLLWQGQFDFKIVGDRLCVDTARKHPSCPADIVPAARAMMPDSKTEAIDVFLGPERLVMGRCTPGSLVSSASSPTASSPPASDAASAPRPAAVPGSAGQNPATPASQRPPISSDTLQGEKLKAPCYWSETPEALVIHSLSVSDQGGPHDMTVEIAGLRSNVSTLRVSRVTPRMIKWLSLLLVAVLLIVFGLVGTRFAVTSGSKGRASLLAWTFIDSETNSYSLSKFQLLLWTVAVVFGYVYLLLAHVLAQGHLSFPPFPTNLTFLLGGAGGTALASSILTRTRGPKGAGGAAPSFSDLLSSGGVLAADRAQFLVWTFVGVGGFLFILLRDLPETITKLPDIDPNLLGAMGLSALVYVGGKSVRLPGPVISKVTATKGTTFDLKIEGQNLHKDAIISVDGQIVDVKRPAPATPATPHPVDPNLLSELKVELDLKGPWAAGDHLLRVANLDGQYAEIWFAENLPKVGSADPPSVTTGTTTTVKLTGTALRTGSTAEWLAPNATDPAVLDAAAVTIKSDTEATVSLAAGTAKGQGTLTLVSPRGMRAAVQIAVT